MRYRLLSAVIVTSVLATASCGGGGSPESSSAGPAVPVAVLVVSAVDRPVVFEAGGVVQGRSAASVAARVMATVTSVRVRPGDRVELGQVLVELDGADLAAAARAAAAGRDGAERGLVRARAEVTAAEAAVTLARATFLRIATLAERRSATPHELDEAQAALASAEARSAAASAAVAEAEAGLARATAGGEGATAVASWTRVVAPFAGVVTERAVDPGDLVVPGTTLVRVEDTRAFELEVRLDESRAAAVTDGMRLRVLVDGPAGVIDLDGRVTEVARAVDVDARASQVTIELGPSSVIRPGMFGRAQVPGPSRASIRVPATAIVARGQLTSVFVVDDGTARMRLVRLGSSNGGEVEVSAGLTAGERVVATPPPALRDGSAVTVRPTSGEAAPTGGTR